MPPFQDDSLVCESNFTKRMSIFLIILLGMLILKTQVQMLLDRVHINHVSSSNVNGFKMLGLESIFLFKGLHIMEHQFRITHKYCL